MYTILSCGCSFVGKGFYGKFNHLTVSFDAELEKNVCALTAETVSIPMQKAELPSGRV